MSNNFQLFRIVDYQNNFKMVDMSNKKNTSNLESKKNKKESEYNYRLQTTIII
ncbi:MAG: hypothetical protein R2863_09165 [Candidatus Kapaibacterium sp.]|nr:hypothetical protein [Ignavibacteria bacterium]